eukprot:TRINITY_DN1693_c0_g1_i3.p1 TRINITY_DN1693_c0_g1~~TRINITY_DN1693_c0_g1_i3.p1  ORF type:complete len:163 (+),score=11.43 TRINITY_DN1693_c0_g1_i3:316-804(+)
MIYECTRESCTDKNQLAIFEILEQMQVNKERMEQETSAGRQPRLLFGRNINQLTVSVIVHLTYGFSLVGILVYLKRDLLETSGESIRDFASSVKVAEFNWCVGVESTTLSTQNSYITSGSKDPARSFLTCGENLLLICTRITTLSIDCLHLLMLVVLIYLIW